MRKFIFILVALSFGLFAIAADKIKDDPNAKTKYLPKFPKIINTNIPGAPVLGQPQMLNGKKLEIRIGKHGLAYPTLFDWNNDGKRDLLVGEFETGEVGSYIKIYLNEGSNKNPKYSGEYNYAKDTDGNLITAYQW